MSQFLSPLISETVDDSGWSRKVRLYKNLVYQSDILGAEVIVPAGFVTDYASIPVWLPAAVWLLGGAGDRSAVVHDYLIREKKADRWVADSVFREALKVCDVSSWRIWLYYLGVRTMTMFKTGQ